MKVYSLPRHGAPRVVRRVSDALVRYVPPGVQSTVNEAEADLVILHAFCYQEVLNAVERLRLHRQGFAIIQYRLRTTERPLTRAWLQLWQRAQLVWSFYDLFQLARDDQPPKRPADIDFKFFYAPLGVDPEVFRPLRPGDNKIYNIVTTGSLAQAEVIAEAALATERVNGTQLHIGPEMYLGNHVKCLLGINDERLAYEYSAASYVAGLRRVEGFELPALEGLMCGARPVMFDVPHYRRWFNDLAVFIPEGNFDGVVESLEGLFRSDVWRVNETEQKLAGERFSWERLVGDFWRRIL
jgi:hypothetical protein